MTVTPPPDHRPPLDSDTLESVVRFFFELGMLKKTRRSGFQFLGTGGESVADHSYRVAMIAYTLARLTDHPDPFRVVCLALFHDVPEARTGDLNYVNKQYVEAREQQAVADLAATLPFGGEFLDLMREYREARTTAAALVHDADQLDLILELKQQQDLGNPYAPRWLEFVLQRVHTETGQLLAAHIMQTDSSAWWFDGRDHWWRPPGQD